MKSTTKDPFRTDAGVVWRSLRDDGPSSVAVLADRCFPVAADGPASSLKALRKRSVRKVLDSLVWMRHQGVVLSAAPSDDIGTAVFHLGVVVIEPRSVTPKVSQKVIESLSGGDEDVWHVSRS